MEKTKLEKIKDFVKSDLLTQKLKEKIKKDSEFKSNMVIQLQKKVLDNLNFNENQISNEFMTNIDRCNEILRINNNSYDDMALLEKMLLFLENKTEREN